MTFVRWSEFTPVQKVSDFFGFVRSKQGRCEYAQDECDHRPSSKASSTIPHCLQINQHLI